MDLDDTKSQRDPKHSNSPMEKVEDYDRLTNKAVRCSRYSGRVGISTPTSVFSSLLEDMAD